MTSDTPRSDVALIIFVKNPILGQAKTRLAATLGDQAALDIYIKLLEYTSALTRKLPFTRYVYYFEEIQQRDLWDSPGTIKRLQSEGDLGIRMHHAFTDVLKNHGKALIIGSDCGELTSEHLQTAMLALTWSDVVLGPTFDGGYYLAGLKKPRPEIFEDIAWSSDTVLRATMTHLLHTQASFKLLQRLSDVDTEEDWVRLGWSTT